MDVARQVNAVSWRKDGVLTMRVVCVCEANRGGGVSHKRGWVRHLWRASRHGRDWESVPFATSVPSLKQMGLDHWGTRRVEGTRP